MNTSEAMGKIIKEFGDRVTISDAECLERALSRIEAAYPDEYPSIIAMLCGTVCASYRLMRRK